ncbi:MAG: 16S rRNA (guanine(527)-N(7))-methyltransferase RsmG [Actinomycetota bacterium]|nr:16S rRNA (guanine(527)-N(7))-methyltransferase RsmG [Actinomycetota bacterium]
MQPETAASLASYAALVRRWAGTLDLVAPSDLGRIESRHIEDSLRIVPLVEGLPPGPCVDVGSGAGFPGIPLAIVDPTRAWTLLEPRARRAAFLEEVVRSLALDCTVVAASAQQAARDPGLAGRHAVATARALADPHTAFQLLMPLVRPEGTAVVFTGRGASIPAGAAEWAPGIAIMRPGAAEEVDRP